MSAFWKSQPVLITGISGFLGSHLAERLIEKGAKIVGTIRDSKATTYIELTGLDRKITVCQADVVDPARTREILTSYDIKYIFHCAAHSIIRKCATDPLSCFDVNVMGTVAVLEAARGIGKVDGIMCMESDKSYGPFDPKDLPYKEEQAIKPKNVYEVSKACAGLVAAAYQHNYGLPVFTIRSANLYGPGDMHLSRLIPGSIMRILRGEAPVLYGDVADYIREFIYVDDAAEGMIALMEGIEASSGEVLNLGSGEKHRIKDVIATLCAMLGSDLEPQVIEKEDIVKEIREQYLDLTKLRRFLPKFKTRSFEDGLAATVAWYKEYYEKGALA